METVSARIDSTMLGYEDHGILTTFLMLDYGGSVQGFGGYSLGNTKSDSVACSYQIRRILETVGVDKWEELIDKNIRVRRSRSFNGKILEIGHLLEDKWYNPELEFEKKLHKEKEEKNEA